MTTNMSNHAYHDRKERINAILNVIEDFGEILVEETSPTDSTANRILTTNGIVIIKNNRTNRIITVYMATVSQTIKIYKSAKRVTFVPENIVRRAKENERKFGKIKEIWE